MLRTLLVGIPVILLCLVLQAAVVAVCLRCYIRFSRSGPTHNPFVTDILPLALVMVLTLVGNCMQMAIWAGMFMLLGEFDDYATAAYHSAVNFATLGYGDIVMSERWRLLGPIEAANGILMFGVSTAAMTAAVIDALKRKQIDTPGS